MKTVWYVMHCWGDDTNSGLVSIHATKESAIKKVELLLSKEATLFDKQELRSGHVCYRMANQEYNIGEIPVTED